MAVLEIPLSTTPLQTLAVQLGEQSCRIAVRQRRTGVFVDLYEQDRPVALGVKALDRTDMVRSPAVSFDGRLFFVDTQGTEPPSYDGLGTRWLLLWEAP
jgi:hypothetical protein